MVALSCLAQHDSPSGVQQRQFHVRFHRDPSRAAQILGSSEYTAHFSGANYKTRRHTVGRVKAFELRPRPLVETCWKPFDHRVESGVNSYPGGRCNQSQPHSGASPFFGHTSSGTLITSSNVSKVRAARNIHCFQETAHGGEINEVFLETGPPSPLISWKATNLDQQTTR